MNVAFIPVRGGSKSIPLKNIKIINGMPLVYWVVKAACECDYIDKVYVSTDSYKIRSTVEMFSINNEDTRLSKIEVISRSAETASDNASTESAMLEFAINYHFTNIVLIQATSPLLRSFDLNRGFEIFEEEGVDSVLSVVKEKRFYWMNNENGFSCPINYDIFQRPRRQDFDGIFMENGAFYITSRSGLIKSGNRLSGNIKIVEMEQDTAYEVDELSDWIIVEALMKKNGIVTSTKMYQRDGENGIKIPEIKMFLTDCDGCLTDGGMYYSEQGDELKKFNTRDGMGFSILKKKGILVGVITGEVAELNRRRAEKLKLDILEIGCKDKLSTIKRYGEMYDIKLENICYVGDDINDIDAIKGVGFGCCPGDAVTIVKEVSDYVTKCNGGAGVVREIVELINDRDKKGE